MNIIEILLSVISGLLFGVFVLLLAWLRKVLFGGELYLGKKKQCVAVFWIGIVLLVASHFVGDESLRGLAIGFVSLACFFYFLVKGKGPVEVGDQQ